MNNRVIYCLIALLLLLGGCAMEGGGREALPPSPSAPQPAATMQAEITPTPKAPAAPTATHRRISFELDEEAFKLCLDHMVNRHLGFYRYSPLRGKKKQETEVEVYYGGLYGYDVYFQLDGEWYCAIVSGERANGPVYERVHAISQDSYEHGTARHELIGIFTYTFDPDCTFTFPNKYADRLPHLIALVVEDLIERDIPGEYVLLFCEYTEQYAYEDGEARIRYIKYFYGREELMEVKVFEDGSTDGTGRAISISEFTNLDYYREKEFMRIEIRIPEKEEDVGAGIRE